MRAPKKEEEPDIDGFSPTKWWQAIDIESNQLLAESSDPHDYVFKKLVADDNVVIRRLYQKTVYRWIEETPKEKK